MVLPFCILATAFVILDVILLIRSVFKLTAFIKKHKKSANLKRKPASLPAAKLKSRTERQSAKARDDVCISSYEEKSSTILSQVKYDATSDEVTMFSSQQIRKDVSKTSNPNKPNNKDVIDDVMYETRSRSAVDLSYELASFSNVFLLVRLKKNLKFLIAIVLLFCLGFGSAIGLTLILCFDDQHLENYDYVEVAMIPAIICQAIIALIMCNTTSDLKQAVLFPVRRLFYACRTVQYRK